MTGRIFRSTFTVAAAVLLSALVIIMGVLYEYFSAVQENQLAAEAELAARGVEAGGLDYLESVSADGYRLTWVDAGGNVLYDSEADASEMDNHAGREEISEALTIGVGESERVSATLSEKTLYRTLRLSDGTVLRISGTQYTVLTLLLGMLQPVAVLAAVAIVLSALLSRRAAKRIVEPLNTIDLDSPSEGDYYEELTPLLTRITRQRRQIDAQLNELEHKKREFETITGSMAEGLVLLNPEGRILSLNRAACRIFGADAASIGRDLMALDRSAEVRAAAAEALAGRHDERTVGIGEREYQLDASPIAAEDGSSGAVILVFDVTDRARAERQRREFTANVSHELKTPLHTIMGSAELIESGIAKPEDVTHFASGIRSEAKRLVALIDDIIQLSRLDEAAEIPGEDVELLSLAAEAAEQLRSAADRRGVTVSVSGCDAVVYGSRRLLSEVAYNLIDNAVKYNVEGGSVSVSVSADGRECVLAVSDTGIGIPPEHQQRVFERFYRVDKSHSRQTGGTGLGLSIVRHAVECLGGKTELTSVVGRGTEVRVTLPLAHCADK